MLVAVAVETKVVTPALISTVPWKPLTVTAGVAETAKVPPATPAGAATG